MYEMQGVLFYWWYFDRRKRLYRLGHIALFSLVSRDSAKF
jgi:hypothetical protein